MFGKDAKSAEPPPPSSPPPSPTPPLPTHRGTPSIFRRFSTTDLPSVSVTTAPPTVVVAEPRAEPAVVALEPELSSQSDPPNESFSPSFLRRLTSDITANSPSLIRRLNHKLQGSDTSYQSNADEPLAEPSQNEDPGPLTEPSPIPGPMATPSLFRKVSETLWSTPRPVRKAEESALDVEEANQPAESVSEVEVQFAPKDEKKGYRTLTRSMSNLSLFKDRKKKRRKKKEEEEFDMSKDDIGFAFLGSAKFLNNRYKDVSLVVYKGWKKSVIRKRKDNGEIQPDKMTKRQKLGRQISSTTLRLKKGSIEVETSTMTDSSLTTYNIEKLVTELPQDENYSVDVLQKTEDKPGCEVM